MMLLRAIAMKPKAAAIESYDFKPTDQLLLDANIWLYIFAPQRPGDYKVEVYSQALANMLAAKSHIYIDVLIVSEFINTYARLKWNLEASHIKNFKIFRTSRDFKPVACEIAAGIGRVLQHCSRIESEFKGLAIDDLIYEYAAGESDFNDQVLIALCKRNGLKLVTHDGDFNGQEISIITANKRLLI